MPVNHELFNEERAAGDATLAGMKIAYESKFENVSMSLSQYAPILPQLGTALKYVPAPSDPTKIKVLDNYEVKGTGDTLNQAIADWQRDLGTKPQGGNHLAWRVLPECDWTYNFTTESVQWYIYARFAVLPGALA